MPQGDYQVRFVGGNGNTGVCLQCDVIDSLLMVQSYHLFIHIWLWIIGSDEDTYVLYIASMEALCLLRSSTDAEPLSL